MRSPISNRDPVTGRILGTGGAARKPNGGDGGAASVDPIAAGTAPGAEPAEPGTRSKRSGGSGGTGTAKTAAKGASLDLSAYAGLWAGLHVQVAKLTATPELAITLDDSKAFLTAVQNVARHYPIVATQKALDWGALIITTSLIYTPRVIAIRQRLAAPPPPPQQPAAPVFRFVPPSPPPTQAQWPQPNYAAPPPNGQAAQEARPVDLHDGAEPFPGVAE